MPNNDIIVLNSILETQKTDNQVSDDEYFEIFSFDQILKDYDLSYDELIANTVDGKDDGGIDGFFIFLNHELINDDIDRATISKNPLLEVYLIQSKTSASFSESAIDKIIATIQDIFDLEKEIQDIQQFYNSQIIAKTELLRKVYLNLAIKHPQVKIKYLYSSKGNSQDIHPKVKNKSNNLCTITEKFFSNSQVNFYFVGSRELLEYVRQEKTYSLKLNFLENYISRGRDNYVVLARLDEYYKFITDGNGSLRQYLFESNVRHYQGNVEVNRDIKNSLNSQDKDIDFWWLNNGITILTSQATITGKSITLDDVQIVNGLQTTTTLYEYMKTLESRDDSRAILIKIIESNKIEARDRIIKATNFQTPIPAASLRATEPIQRDIEDFFLQQDLFYDRRKNYYKNVGKPSDKIISIPYLAQSFTAIINREPHIAKSRPTSIIKGDKNYSKIFNASVPMSVYLICAKLMKTIDQSIKYKNLQNLSVNVENSLLDSGNMKILNFQIAMLFSIKLFRKTNYTMGDLEALTTDSINNLDVLNNVIIDICQLTNQYHSPQTNTFLAINTIAKRADFTKFLLDNVNL